eukprot:UN27960
MKGLEYLHSQRIAHADLKPANVLIAKNGVAKVCDFGVSELLQGENKSSYIQLCKTTPAYKAPEVIRKTLQDIDVRFRAWPADIWAAGLILFEMVCGSNPFHVPNDAYSTENTILEYNPFDKSEDNNQKFEPHLGKLDIGDEFNKKKMLDVKAKAGKEEICHLIKGMLNKNAK